MCSRIILINFTAGHNQKKGNHSSQGTGSSLCGVDCIIRLALALFLQPTFFTFSSQITSWHKVYRRGRKRANDPGIESVLPRSQGEQYTFSGCAMQHRVYSVHMERTGSPRHHSIHPMSITAGPFLHLQPDFHLFFHGDQVS